MNSGAARAPFEISARYERSPIDMDQSPADAAVDPSEEFIAAPPHTLLSAFRKIGPGIILAGSIVGSGELLLTTALGAEYGFVFLWLILFSCVIKVFVQLELGALFVILGEADTDGLGRVAWPATGAHWLVWWWFIMLLITVFQLGAMVGGVGQALNLAFPNVATQLANVLEAVTPALADTIRTSPSIRGPC